MIIDWKIRRFSSGLSSQSNRFSGLKLYIHTQTHFVSCLNFENRTSNCAWRQRVQDEAIDQWMMPCIREIIYITQLLQWTYENIGGWFKQKEQNYHFQCVCFISLFVVMLLKEHFHFVNRFSCCFFLLSVFLSFSFLFLPIFRIYYFVYINLCLRYTKCHPSKPPTVLYTCFSCLKTLNHWILLSDPFHICGTQNTYSA